LISEKDDEAILDFLTDPWVLVQLPFQPTLLHQWSLALLTEYLRFEKEVSGFHNYATKTSSASKVELAKTTVDQIRAFAEFTLTAVRAFLSEAYADSSKKISARGFWRILMTKALPLADVLKSAKKRNLNSKRIPSVVSCDCESGQNFKKVF